MADLAPFILCDYFAVVYTWLLMPHVCISVFTVLLDLPVTVIPTFPVESLLASVTSFLFVVNFVFLLTVHAFLTNLLTAVVG